MSSQDLSASDVKMITVPPNHKAGVDPELQELLTTLKELEDAFNTHPEKIPALLSPSSAAEENSSPAVENETPTIEITQDTQDPIDSQPIELFLESTPLLSDRKLLPKKQAVKPLIWIGLTCTVITFSYLFFNFSYLTNAPEWHSTLYSLCRFFGCNVPLPQNLSKIKTSKLIMRLDPKNSHVYLLDAIVSNEAEFAQAFPDIEVQLSDHHLRPIAQHRFPPAIYRKGQLSTITAMPSHQAIHIALEIPNPGISILNYELKFYPSLQSKIKRYHTSHVPSHR